MHNRAASDDESMAAATTTTDDVDHDYSKVAGNGGNVRIAKKTRLETNSPSNCTANVQRLRFSFSLPLSLLTAAPFNPESKFNIEDVPLDIPPTNKYSRKSDPDK